MDTIYTIRINLKMLQFSKRAGCSKYSHHYSLAFLNTLKIPSVEQIFYMHQGISIPIPFFSLKWSKGDYGVKNAPTQSHISLHNEVYSINGVIYFFFVHHSIIEWEMEQDWSNFTPFSLLLHFRGKNGVLHWRCSKSDSHAHSIP